MVLAHTITHILEIIYIPIYKLRMNQILASLIFHRRSVLYITYRSCSSWHNLSYFIKSCEEDSCVKFLTRCKDTKKYQNPNKKIEKIIYIIRCTHTIRLHEPLRKVKRLSFFYFLCIFSFFLLVISRKNYIFAIANNKKEISNTIKDKDYESI